MKDNTEQQNFRGRKVRNKNRRDFLKVGTAVGVTLCLTDTLSNTAEAQGTANEQRNDSLAVITQRRTLGSGNYALPVSALGFGCMGMNYHRGPHPSREEMIRLARQAVERGVTLFDTAETYGPFVNEELVGAALSSLRNQIVISTKFGFNYEGTRVTGLNSRPANIRQAAEGCLKRLGLETIELFYQHRRDPNVPIEEVAGTVKELIQEGKVRRWGLCEVSPATIRRAHAVLPITVIQSEYHLMWREPEKEVLPVCAELGIGFVPYSPINRGFLAGNLNQYTRFDSGNDNRNTLPRFTPEAMQANLAIVEALNRFGRPRGATAAQVALAWLLAKQPWIVPIPGTTKLAHLEENLRAAALRLSAAEVNEIENTVSKIQIVGDRYPAEQQRQVE